MGPVKKAVGHVFANWAVKSSGAVSPETRATARSTPVTMPLRAARQIICSVTRQRVSPRARPDSRRVSGTIMSMASVVRMTTGNMRMARATEPARPELAPIGTTQIM